MENTDWGKFGLDDPVDDPDDANLEDLGEDEAGNPNVFDVEEVAEKPEDPEELTGNKEKEPELEGADRQCYELLSQLRAREKSDSIGWTELENGDHDLDNVNESEAQRLGRGGKTSVSLDRVLRHGQERDVDPEVHELSADEQRQLKDMQSKLAKKAKTVTLAAVFSSLGLAEEKLQTIDPVLPSLWRCLMNLRIPADAPWLPRPESFRVSRKELNWHQRAEQEAARIRAVTGLSAKRTSRAAAWRNMAASFKKSIALMEADGTSRTEEVATGAVALFVPTYANEFKIGMVMAVWRYSALKNKRWGAKPATMPVVRDMPDM